MKWNLIATAAVLGLAGAANAQPYDLSWYTIDGGGGTSTGGVFSLSGTIGQPDAGGPMTGGAYSLTGGFWVGGSVTPPGNCPPCPADFNQDDGVDDLDIAAFFFAFEQGEECADVNDDDGIDDLDIAFFFAQFEQGC